MLKLRDILTNKKKPSTPTDCTEKSPTTNVLPVTTNTKSDNVSEAIPDVPPTFNNILAIDTQALTQGTSTNICVPAPGTRQSERPYTTRAVKLKKKSNAISEIASDDYGKHTHGVRELCSKH